MARIVVVISIVLLVAAALAVGAFALLRGQGSPEGSARYYPVDTLVYVWFSLDPVGEQDRYIREVWGKAAEHPGFSELQSELDEFLWEGATVDGLGKWVGPDVSAGLLQMGLEYGEPTEFGVTIDVRDRDEAFRFVQRLISKANTRGATIIQSDSTGDFLVWNDIESDLGGIALSEDLLIYASTENALYQVVSRAAMENKEESLMDSVSFQAAREQYLLARFASAFINARRFPEVLAGTGVMTEEERQIVDDLADETAPWAGASFEWKKSGIEAEWVAPFTENRITRQLEPVTLMSEPAQMVPEETMAMIAWGYDPSLDNLRQGLAEIDTDDLMDNVVPDHLMPGYGSPIVPGLMDGNTNLAQLLDLGLTMGGLLLGVDLERDFIDHLSGQLIASAGNVVDPVWDEEALKLGLMLSYRDGSGDALNDTITSLVESMGSSGFAEPDIRKADMGNGETALVLGSDGGYGYGVSVSDGWLTGSSTEEWLVELMQTRRGERESLAEQASYQLAAAEMDPPKHFEAFIDLKRVFTEKSDDDLPPQYDMLGALLIRDNGDMEYTRIRMMLTLWTED